MAENRFLLPVVIEKDEDGYYAFCPDLQGCYSQGDSYEEVLSNIRDANSGKILHPKVLKSILEDAEISVEQFTSEL